ncbi:unnamed protein product [Triticum turgidum subsp. durum]|uniref:Pectin acetylesterase n=1 Tax=Triticum turgidum subsp. durum TaxID=4567 RepID=A0A9R1RQ78_TRITD|nr:unnamed protein product [Triticum turgidum subsp. durum]
MVKTRTGGVGPCALLALVLLLAGSCVSVQAADEQATSGGGRRRRPHRRSAASVADMMVPITFLNASVDKGAVCMDGTPAAYHLDRGSGAGSKSWIVNLEGGGWCNNARTCRFRTRTHHGSSNFMERQISFTGIMSASPAENPDFYNWNRVKIRYCDSASFAGDTFDKATGLYFRGQRIWEEAIQHLLSIGMASADRALLTGCSAGGLAAILHCDQGVAPHLPPTCTDHLDATSCFFPQDIIDSIKTPIFLLNAAYDVWQIEESLAPSKADPSRAWRACKFNRSACNASQINFLQGFRDQMVASVRGFSSSKSNGLFINSCFAHCQSELPATWNGTPAIQNKRIAKSVGDWYFGRAEVKAIDCPYPCDNTCRNII